MVIARSDRARARLQVLFSSFLHAAVCGRSRTHEQDRRKLSVHQAILRCEEPVYGRKLVFCVDEHDRPSLFIAA